MLIMRGTDEAYAAYTQKGRGPSQVQAAIARCHATAHSVEATDWDSIVRLHETLARVAPSPVVELDRAVAVSMASGPTEGLAIVDALADSGVLRGSHLLPPVRGELLARLGRDDAARAELLTAAEPTGNEREAALLRRKAEALPR